VEKTPVPAGEGQAGGKSRFLRFWTTVPGILTGSAALISAIVSVIALVHPSRGSEGPASPTSPSEIASAAGTSAAPVSSTPNASPANGVLTESRLTMRPGEYADLDQARIGNAISNADLFLLGGGVGGQVWELTTIGGPLAPVSGQQVDKKTCVAALKTRNDSYELLSQFQVGSELCVQTQEDDVAVLRIVSVPGPGSPEFVYTYTVWQ
jgi:hypothetical protein